MAYTISCKVCSKDFSARVPHAAYCSKGCRKVEQRKATKKSKRKRLKKEGIQKSCETCGEIFLVLRENARYCSSKCFGKAQGPRKKRLKTNCLNCEVELEYIIGAHIPSFCSTACMNSLYKTKEKVYKTCPTCKKKFNRGPPCVTNKRKFCSKTCANVGENNAMYGNTKLDDKEAEQVCELYASGSTSIELSEQFNVSSDTILRTIRINGGEVRDTAGENNGMYGKNHTLETREKLSEIVSERYKNGWPSNNYNQKGEFYSFKMEEQFSYRSSWELEVMRWLDNNDKVEWFQFEPFTIKYEYEYKRNYLPDFLIKFKDFEKPRLVEVKPKYFKLHDINRAKFQAARSYSEENNMLFEIWSEEKISVIKEENNI